MECPHCHGESVAMGQVNDASKTGPWTDALTGEAATEGVAEEVTARLKNLEERHWDTILYSLIVDVPGEG